MNTTMGVWALVLGGVLIPGGDSSFDQAGQSTYEAPTSTFEMPNLEPGYPGSLGQQPGYFRNESGFPSRGQERGPTSFSPTIPQAPFGESSQVNRQSTSRESLMPFAPTDPSAASGGAPWGAPTAGSLPTDRAPEGQPPLGGSASIPRMPGPSAFARPRATRPAYGGRSPYESFIMQQSKINQAGLPGTPAYSPQANVAKPFTRYRRPAAQSPYMELNRIDYGYNVIDPYNQYVKPQLDRQMERRQLDSQIQGLQHSVRNLGRQTQSVQGVVIPQYYMNHGSYYPGFNR